MGRRLTHTHTHTIRHTQSDTLRERDTDASTHALTHTCLDGVESARLDLAGEVDVGKRALADGPQEREVRDAHQARPRGVGALLLR